MTAATLSSPDRAAMVARVPLAGYCARCERPAVRMDISPDRRVIVHRGGGACELGNPSPAPGGGRRSDSKAERLRHDLLAVLADGRARSAKTLRVAARAPNADAVYAALMVLLRRGRVYRTWTRDPGCWLWRLPAGGDS